MRRAVLLPAGLILALLAGPQGGSAQVPDSIRVRPDTLPVLPDSALQDPVPLPAPIQEGEAEEADTLSGIITPGGAFLRSAILPGWGHARVGAYGRGAFYFLAEAASVFMVLKSQNLLELARDRVTLWEEIRTAEYRAQGTEDLDEIEALLEEDEKVSEFRGLVEARSGQREDWMAMGIFLLFLGGADAFVSAHLADFPGAVEVNATPTGGVAVGMSIPLNFRELPR